MKDVIYLPQDGVDEQAIAKGGVAIPFPWRLHEMLKATAEEGLQDIVSWAPHGRAFTVHKRKEFEDLVLKRFFSQTKYPSFQRQLNLYNFHRFSHGPDKGAYYHVCFVKGHPNLVRNMIRKKIKGTKVRRSPTEEPNFYDPAWKSHFGATIPEHLKKSAFTAVTPAMAAAASKKEGSVRASSPANKTVKKGPAANSTRVNKVSTTPFVDILPAPRSSRQVVAQCVSDEESSWDSLDLDAALDSDLLLFEGHPFHFLEGEDLDFSINGMKEIITSMDGSSSAFVAL